MGGNPYRRFSLLGFAHPVVGPPFQVQVQCRKLTHIWDNIWDESRTRLCFVLFLSCIIFKQDQNMYTFFVSKGLQRDCDYSLSYIFVYCELNMQEWVSIYECDIGTPDIHKFPRVVSGTLRIWGVTSLHKEARVFCLTETLILLSVSDTFINQKSSNQTEIISFHYSFRLWDGKISLFFVM